MIDIEAKIKQYHKIAMDIQWVEIKHSRAKARLQELHEIEAQLKNEIEAELRKLRENIENAEKDRANLAQTAIRALKENWRLKVVVDAARKHITHEWDCKTQIDPDQTDINVNDPLHPSCDCSCRKVHLALSALDATSVGEKK